MPDARSCPSCGARLPIGADECRSCGAKVKPYVPWWLYTIGFVFLLILMLGFGDPAGMIEIYSRVVQSFL